MHAEPISLCEMPTLHRVVLTDRHCAISLIGITSRAVFRDQPYPDAADQAPATITNQLPWKISPSSALKKAYQDHGEFRMEVAAWPTVSGSL